MNSLVQYPWRTRLGWSCRGYMYFVDVCESECLDVARGLWLTGAEYIVLYVREQEILWRYRAETYRDTQKGGYSER